MFKLARSRPLAAALRAATKVRSAQKPFTATRDSTKQSTAGHTCQELSPTPKTIPFHPRVSFREALGNLWHWCAEGGGCPLSGGGRVNCQEHWYEQAIERKKEV